MYSGLDTRLFYFHGWRFVIYGGTDGFSLLIVNLTGHARCWIVFLLLLLLTIIVFSQTGGTFHGSKLIAQALANHCSSYRETVIAHTPTHTDVKHSFVLTALVSTHTNTHTYVCMYICMYVCMYVCMLKVDWLMLNCCANFENLNFVNDTL